jgi:hypothetical protein
MGNYADNTADFLDIKDANFIKTSAGWNHLRQELEK